ncbi:MAG: DUF393 domain-containing protein [Phycisphaeraceae bacterium]|nr:MAG: DUF393 domain-containing protein [Phycisphaeraceae bacterium]
MTAHPRTENACAALTLLIDGGCSLCAREVRLLKRLDRGRGILAFEDISGPHFVASDWGVTHEEAMAQMHAYTSDGDKVIGMEVFRRAYALVGWGWLWAPTGWPILRPAFDALYRLFARNRVRWFSRCSNGSCAMPRRRDHTEDTSVRA